MPIKRSSEQPSRTLEEYYNNLHTASTNYHTDAARKMLDFIQLVNETFTTTLIWGLTSHARLVLQNTGDYKTNWYVIVSNIGTEEYYFEYLLPPDKQPWGNAYVRGEASNLDEAKKYLLIAMNESRGWAGNEELKKLLHENGIAHTTGC